MAMKGMINYINPRGYGFISVEGITEGVFFHGRDLREIEFKDIFIGARVTIDRIEDGRKGSTAREVRLA